MSHSRMNLNTSSSSHLPENSADGKRKKQNSRLNSRVADDVDFFKELKSKSKLNDIFDRISLYKSQLKSLVDHENGQNGNEDVSSSNLNESSSSGKSISGLGLGSSRSQDDDLEETQIFNDEKISLNNSNLSVTKSAPVASKFQNFSNLVRKTIDLIYEEVKEEILHTVRKDSFDLKTSTISKSNFNNSKQQNKAKSLMYKAVLVQNLGKFLFYSDENESEMVKVPYNTKMKAPSFSFLKRKSANAFKREENKRRRIVCYNSTPTRRETINFDHCKSNAENIPRNTMEEIDFENLDWSEPFYLDGVNGYDPSFEELQQHSNERNEESEGYNETLQSPNAAHSASSSNYAINEYRNAFDSLENRRNKKPNDLNRSDDRRRVWECPICFEESKGQVIVTTLCGHIFCKACIENYHSTQGKRCPACCTDIRNQPLITLYNF